MEPVHGEGSTNRCPSDIMIVIFTFFSPYSFPFILLGLKWSACELSVYTMILNEFQINKCLSALKRMTLPISNEFYELLWFFYMHHLVWSHIWNLEFYCF